MLRAFVEFERLDGIVLTSSVPQLVREYEAFAERWAGVDLLVLGPGVSTGMTDSLRRPARGRARPDRERRRGPCAPRRARGRRRLRDLDQLRRRLGRRRVRRRRAGARHRGLDGRALRARRATAEGAVRRAGARDQPDDHRRAPVGPGLRLRRPGGRDRQPHPSRAGGPRRARDRHGRPRRPDRTALRDDHRRRPGAAPSGAALVWERNNPPRPSRRRRSRSASSRAARRRRDRAAPPRAGPGCRQRPVRRPAAATRPRRSWSASPAPA